MQIKFNVLAQLGESTPMSIGCATREDVADTIITMVERGYRVTGVKAAYIPLEDACDPLALLAYKALVNYGLKVIVGGSTSLYCQHLQLAKPQDLDLLIVDTDYINLGLKELEKLGWSVQIYNSTTNNLFDIHAQAKLGGLKIDIFKVTSQCPVVNDGMTTTNYAQASVTWAARGFYAAKGYAKAIDQVTSEGMCILKPDAAAFKLPQSVPAYVAAHQTATTTKEVRTVMPSYIGEMSFFDKLWVNRAKKRSKLSYPVGAYYKCGKKFSIGWNESQLINGTVVLIHAEDMAINNYYIKYGVMPQGGTMYCSLSPCSQCSKLLTSYGIQSFASLKYTGRF